IVGHAEHGIVDEDLDVLAELPAVPEGVVELGEPAAERLEQRADGGAGRQRLLEHAPRRAVAAHEARGPADDLDGRGGHRSVRRGRFDSLGDCPRPRCCGVRCCQCGPRARRAVSCTSNTSVAIFRTAARRSGFLSSALRAGSSRTLSTASVYSRTWSVGAPARAGATAPATRARARTTTRNDRVMKAAPPGAVYRASARWPRD